MTWEFLRFVREDDGKGRWRPAAGSFPAWPTRSADITYCDPCCGSGHFLVEAFAIIAALRRQEEGLSAEDVAVAVLRDNLHGLEIDGRCVQIAAFNVALAAWKLAGAPIQLPTPHIAWVGAPPPMSRPEMAALGNGDTSLRRALETLHDQFAQAPLLGSLLDIGARDLLDADLRERGEAALAKLYIAEPERAEGAVAARGLLDAAALLGRRHSILATNVPFLQRGKQEAALTAFLEAHYTEGRADLATAMLQRMLALSSEFGTVAAVSPQNWTFQDSYESFRSRILSAQSISVVVGLGSGAFEEIRGQVVNVCLSIITQAPSKAKQGYFAIDLNTERSSQAKASSLPTIPLDIILQAVPRQAVGSIISLSTPISGSRFSDFVDYRNGLQTGDYERFGQKFWEQSELSQDWSYFQTTVRKTVEFGGMEGIVRWENGIGTLASSSAVVIRGTQAWDRQGVAINAMGQLACARYEGTLYDDNTVTLIPKDPSHLPAIWAFCSSPLYAPLVRQSDKALKVRGGLVKVPFDPTFPPDEKI